MFRSLIADITEKFSSFSSFKATILENPWLAISIDHKLHIRKVRSNILKETHSFLTHPLPSGLNLMLVNSDDTDPLLLLRPLNHAGRNPHPERFEVFLYLVFKGFIKAAHFGDLFVLFLLDLLSPLVDFILFI